MANKFANAVKAVEAQKADATLTWNGALGYKTTGSQLLNMFSTFGNMQNDPDQKIINYFTNAFEENNLAAMKLLFYFRDIREGQGRRKQFQVVLKQLALHQTELVIKNIDNIINFGYWSDLYALYGTPAESFAIKYWLEAIVKEGNILAAKWCPTESQSVGNRYYIDKFLTHAKIQYNMSAREYRKLVSGLRSQGRILEKLMSEKKWAQIDYSKIPSIAGLKYRTAFYRNDNARYEKFIEDVKKGVKKINTSVLNPVDIVLAYLDDVNAYSYSYKKLDKTLEIAWTNLKDVFDSGKEVALMPVLDCSGSMESRMGKSKIRPMVICHALGIYCAERLPEPFKNMYQTFSASAKYHTLTKKTLHGNLMDLKKNSEVCNTNLKAVFDEMLSVALTNNLKSEDLPSLLIITDGQFDSQVDNSKTVLQLCKNVFNKKGLELPKVIFWNVNSAEAKPVYKSETNTMLVSGYSQNILKYVLQNIEIKNITPEMLMWDVINNERYSSVRV